MATDESARRREKSEKNNKKDKIHTKKVPRKQTMEYRISKEWTPHAVITAVAVNIAIVLMGRATAESVEFIGDPETRKASRRDPKEATKACAEAVETWLTEALQGETLPRKLLKMLRAT